MSNRLISANIASTDPFFDEKKIADSLVIPDNPDNKQIVAGIGASAGGLEALQDFFKAMPMDTGLAFVVIQHLSPDFKSMMDELLARCTRLEIHLATDGLAIRPNTIYLIPPRKNLSVFHDKLFLEDQSPKKGLNLPVDIFFRSLAAEKGRHAIGIILSGTGSDGTLGARAIKEAGGMLMVQDEQSAKFDGMPRSVIATGLVDYVLPPEQMPGELVKYTKHPFIRKGQLLESMASKDIDTMTKIILILRDFSGIDFSYYKENTVVRRLERRVSINQFNNLEDYLNLLAESNKEKEILFREMLIGVTRFFRDAEAFKSLKKSVLSRIVDGKKKLIRIWSVGCSTGEEVYSLAMMINEAIENTGCVCECKIFATDIDRHALDVASQGFYPESIAADVDTHYLAKYFTRRENGYQVNEGIRRMIVFATHNLLKDPPFSKLDLIVCRNLFIYLKPDIQSRMLSIFYNSMTAGSFLFMGSSETIGDMGDAFENVDFKWKIYQYKSGYKPPLFQQLPALQSHKSEMERLMSSRKNPADKARFDHVWGGVLNAFVPPSVIIDQEDNIIHVINDTNDFVRAQPGQFSQNLFTNLPHELSLFVSTQLRKLKKGTQVISLENITGIKGFEDKKITIQGRVLSTGPTPYYMLSFIAHEAGSPDKEKDTGSIEIDQQAMERVGELEKELQFTRESLQATVEELETSNEELQSSNEELIASNEELQSTNEELQSVNEELYTVNSEFQNKIEELSRLNNDLNNLLINTEVGALYLDSKLCIRKITPIISKITNIRDNDRGRPVSHISVMDEYPGMFDDIMHVADTLQPLDREIVVDSKTIYFCRIRPYRSDVHAVEGILLTFVDISSLKDVEEDLRKNRELLSMVLDNSPLAKVLVDQNGQISYANKRAETIFGITRKQIVERTYDASAWKITDTKGKPIPPDELPFGIIKKTLKPIYGFQHFIRIPGKKKVLLTINGAPLVGKEGQFDGVVFTIGDAHEIKE
jgi:two-component system, chemotaxis family, CheB/CheR fusion protein